jgi:hypothetical protein
MPRLPVHAFLLVLAVALTSASCGDDDSTTSPTSPTPVYVTDTFSGTLATGETARHTFTAKTGGSIQIAVTAMAPDATLTMGIGLGTWDGTACSVVLQTSAATLNSAFSASATSAGNYCVTFFDVGNVATTTDYTLSVVHP